MKRMINLNYLRKVLKKSIPLTPPKVDRATKTGTIHAQLPYNFSANVTATASAESTSPGLSAEWNAMMVNV